MRPTPASLVLVTLVAAACSDRAGYPANVIAPFDSTPIVFREATVLPLVDFPPGDQTARDILAQLEAARSP